MVFGREYRRVIAALGSGSAPRRTRRHTVSVGYSLDRLGWLQFEQLCTRLLELEGSVPGAAWAGASDRCRAALIGAPLGPPLLTCAMPGPVLVHCAWIAPGGWVTAEPIYEANVSQSGSHGCTRGRANACRQLLGTDERDQIVGELAGELAGLEHVRGC